MRAMVLEKQSAPLVARDLPDPNPGPGEVWLSVEACGVCRTDLHILDGELSHPSLPLTGARDRRACRCAWRGCRKPEIGQTGRGA